MDFVSDVLEIFTMVFVYVILFIWLVFLFLCWAFNKVLFQKDARVVYEPDPTHPTPPMPEPVIHICPNGNFFFGSNEERCCHENPCQRTCEPVEKSNES